MNFKTWFESFEELEDVKGYQPIINVLQKMGITYTKTPNLKKQIIVFEYKNEQWVIDDFEYPEPKRINQWLDERSWKNDTYSYIDEKDFNKEFWEGVNSWSRVYHGTTIDNWTKIKETGVLSPRNATRGMSNKHVGNAVFASLSHETTEYHYDLCLEINVSMMKRSGYMPVVSQEPEIESAENLKSLAWTVGVEDYEPDVESGIDFDTIIFHGPIPVKYIQKV